MGGLEAVSKGDQSKNALRQCDVLLAFFLIFMSIFVLNLVNESRWDWLAAVSFLVVWSRRIEGFRRRAPISAARPRS